MNKSADASVKKRKNIVKQAIANQHLEGLTVSRESRKIADEYVAGKLTARQAADKIRAQYGVRIVSAIL